MTEVPVWLVALGVAAPLVALAGSAIAFVYRQFAEAKVRKRREFFELLKTFDDADSGFFSRLASTYRLREFKEDREFLARYLEQSKTYVSGTPHMAEMLKNEMQSTIDHLQSAKS